MNIPLIVSFASRTYNNVFILSNLRVNGVGLHVEEGEQVGQSTHAIDTVAEHDCSTLNERYVRKVCSIRRIFVST